MKHSRAVVLLLMVTLVSPEAAFCWGGRAHSVIDRTAVDTLPSDGPVFLKKYVDYIASSASIPDSWRGASEPFSKIEEDPNHGWFREQFAFIGRRFRALVMSLCWRSTVNTCALKSPILKMRGV